MPLRKHVRRYLKAVYLAGLRAVLRSFAFLAPKDPRWGPPLGFYSALGDPRDLPIVREGQRTFPAGPESLRARSRLNQDGNQPWPIFWQRIRPARLVGPCLAVLDDRKQMMIESVSGYDHWRGDPSTEYVRLPAALHLDGSWTSIISRWCNTERVAYFHWMLDGLPRLALLDQFPPETRILVPGPLDAFRRESLEMLGLLERCRITPERHVVLEDYYYSSLTAMTGCDNSYAVEFLRDRFLGETPEADLKIYVSREGFTRGADDEARLAEFFRGRGWTVLKSQDHTLREQIALFARARSVCAIHGASLTNLLWCRTQSLVLELCPATYLNGCYESLALNLELDYRYMIFPADAEHRLKIDYAALASALRDLE